MRIWLVPHDELSDQHLLGQHRELHMLLAMIENPRFNNHRMAHFYRDKVVWLERYHESLVNEMWHRFRSKPEEHKTPFKMPKKRRLSRKFEPPEQWVEFDRIDLARRYQSETRFEYRWTRRPVPEWVDNPKALRAELGHIPAHYAGAQSLGVAP